MALKIMNPNTVGDADKRLPGAASTKAYVVGAGAAAVISSIIVCNSDAALSDNFYIYVVEAVVGSAANKTLIYKGALPPGESFTVVAGVSLAAVGYFENKLPIFGVCLGHQVIVQYFGGKIGHAPEPVHGKPSRVTHNEKDIFAGVENPLQAGRYHSLCAIKMPDCLEKTAEFEGIVMGVQHKEFPIFGVQFHPESILTPAGGKIIENVLSIAEKRKNPRPLHKG